MTYTRSPDVGGVSPIPPEQDPTGSNAEELAMNQWMAQRLMKLNPEVEPRVRGAIRGIVGSDFSDEELKALEGRALGAAKYEDIPALAGMRPGNPVYITPQQERIVERIIGGLGADALGRRGQDAYHEALKSGRIRRGR